MTSWTSADFFKGDQAAFSAVLWLVSVFHLDDGVDSQMSTEDWWLGGVTRAIQFVVTRPVF